MSVYLTTILQIRFDPDFKEVYTLLLEYYPPTLTIIIPLHSSTILSVIVQSLQKFNKIIFQDEKNQVLTTNVWFDHEWYDELLKWDPNDFGGIVSLQIPCDKIWLPDIVLYNR